MSLCSSFGSHGIGRRAHIFDFDFGRHIYDSDFGQRAHIFDFALHRFFATFASLINLLLHIQWICLHIHTHRDLHTFAQLGKPFQMDI